MAAADVSQIILYEPSVFILVIGELPQMIQPDENGEPSDFNMVPPYSMYWAEIAGVGINAIAKDNKTAFEIELFLIMQG